MKTSYFPDGGRWFKGNLHSHTTRSDGTVDPLVQAADYRARGYHFLAITDHNVMNAFAQACREDFLVLPGWERDILYEQGVKCTHLVGIPIDAPSGELCLSEPRCTPQDSTDQQLVERMKGRGQFVVIAHPVWSRTEPEELLAMHGYDAVEVFNTGCERLCHAGGAAVYWDMLLRRGRRVWGISCDDTHGKTQKSDRFGGWVQVKAPALTHEGIMAALTRGEFYASSGPEILDFGRDGDRVYLACSPCREIHFVSWPPRGHSIYREETALTYAEYPLKGGESYLRAECVDEGGCCAWTNPIFFD